jgi:hypothetical protein
MIVTKSEKRNFLRLVTKTWARDSHGLYDYETTSMKVQNIDLSSNCIILRRKNDIKCHSLTHIKSPDETELFQVSFTNGGKVLLSNHIEYGMIPSEENIVRLQDKLWYVIKSEDLMNNHNNQIVQNISNSNEIVRIFKH